jgi:ferredoxin-thioredoxin reductase catalytic chain
MMPEEVTSENVEKLFQRLSRDADKGRYHLNPDRAFTDNLLRGLAVTQDRYGYMACPCRLASGKREEDLDIICPCDYRDADIVEFGACYCGLYVSEKIFKGEQKLAPVPERRLPSEKRAVRQDSYKKVLADGGFATAKHQYPVWRCKVCGYLCARDSPPEKCPVCGVEKDRFEPFA